MGLKDVAFTAIQELLRESDKTQTVGEGKKLCKDFRDRYNLTDKEVLDIVNRRF